MAAVYDDHVHQNPGFHLDGGISDDKEWQTYWRRLITYHSHLYIVPHQCREGKDFLDLLADLFDGIRTRRWNAERVIVYILVVLQQAPGVTRARDIKHRLASRMKDWKAGKYDMLVEDTERLMEAAQTKARGNLSSDARHRRFANLMHSGEIRKAVRFLSETEDGSIVLDPADIDAKTQTRVDTVLQSKHPAARTPDSASLPIYDSTPEFIDVTITADHVRDAARRLSGSAVSLHNMPKHGCSLPVTTVPTSRTLLRLFTRGRLTTWCPGLLFVL